MLTYVIVFTAGALTEAMLLLADRIRRQPPFALLVAGLYAGTFAFVAFGSLFAGGLELGSVFSLATLFFPVFFCVFFARDFLPVINLQLLVSLTITLAYALFESDAWWAFNIFNEIPRLAWLILLVPIGLYLRKKPVKSLLPVAGYAAYLGVVIVLAIIQNHELHPGLGRYLGAEGPAGYLESLNDLFSFRPAPGESVVDVFCWGMSYIFLAAHLALVFFYTLPKAAPASAKLMETMAARFKSAHLPDRMAAGVLLFQACLFVVNARLHLFLPRRMIFAWYVLLPCFIGLAAAGDRLQKRTPP